MTQTLLTIFIPTLAAFMGILSDLRGWSRINASITSLENRLDARLGGFEQRLQAATTQGIGNII